MSTTANALFFPYSAPSPHGADEAVLRVPTDVNTMAGFRRWIQGSDFPEHLKAHFIQGSVFIDMPNEIIQSHVFVKKCIFQTLPNITDDEDLGEFLTDGVLLTNKKAGISNNPDGLFVSWESLDAGRARFLTNKDGIEREIVGTPDWVLEVVSDSSVKKDYELLRQAYFEAGIPEYWLIDARGDEVHFVVHHWRKNGYFPATAKNGWLYSKVFERGFQLTRTKNRRGAWRFRLLVESASRGK